MKDKETLDDMLVDFTKEVSLVKRMSSYIICWFGITISMSIFDIRDSNTIAAFILLLIATIITIRYLKIGVLFFFFILLASTGNLISYFHISFNIFHVNIVMFSLLLIHCKMNKKLILPVLQYFISSVIDTENPDANRSSIERFKKRFESYSNEKLKQIVSDNELTPEAIQAAKELVADINS